MESWEQTIGFVAAALDTGEALAELLREAVLAGGANAGAILDENGCCRVVEGIDAVELEPMLCAGGTLAATFAERESWPDVAFWLSQPVEEEDSSTRGQLAIVPLRVRGIPIGGLVLLYGDRVAVAASRTSVLTALAGIAALVLDHDQLYEEARRARQARDHFLTAINHELRTPATAVMLQAGMLNSGLTGDLPPRIAKTVRSLEENVEELSRVMERVLDLGRLEADSLPVRGDVIDPRSLVIDLLRRVEPSASRKDLTVAVYVPRSLPALQTDAQRLSRILLHLFGNAIKFTESGGIEVRVERSMGVQGGHRRSPQLVVRVTDTGCGIPVAQVKRIFEPFAQVDEGARTDSSTRGVGLGLPIARKLAQSLGGDVRIESTEGQGTTATLQLPYR